MYCAPSMHLISTDLAGYLLYGINPLWHPAARGIGPGFRPRTRGIPFPRTRGRVAGIARAALGYRKC